ncbi:hypothetical protein [Archangium primigenium]|uniref:hypothetical protein n=1 Tax=[Archangium] primigenium TaxID=2792470 RepID=UPI00195A8278|nr:hypothetical protein [Archangium primigenium]MBM7113273.1 hypothetical protein [Archangium primigenium]
MTQRDEIKEGMIVRSVDGHKLGKVYAIGEAEFYIEKGLFFPKDYSVRYSEISNIRDGEIVLTHGRDSLKKFSLDDVSNADPLDSGRTAVARANVPPITDWRELDRPAKVSELEGLRSDDLGVQGVSPHNTEGASASPLLTEEDRRIGSRPSASMRDMPGYVPPMPDTRPAMRASSSLDETVGVVSPGARDSSLDRTIEEDYRAALVEDDYRAALVEDELYEERRRSVRGDSDLEGQRRLSLSGDDSFIKRG